MSRRLVARLDSIGDVLLAGPAIRAVAASGLPVDVLSGPSGSSAAALLPEVEEVLGFEAPWVGFEPVPTDRAAVQHMVTGVERRGYEEALILTSYHQSPLPLALLLRLAGVPRIAATCVDFPGTLLDVRHPYCPELHEVEQSLALCAAAGHELPEGDDGSLRVRSTDAPPGLELPVAPFVVVHPGASVPARALPSRATAELVGLLASEGIHVLVTGTAAERDLVHGVAGATSELVTPLAGALGLGQLAHVLERAAVLVCGNTGPAHLAAAVRTPVVQAFAPVVPARRWAPWQVPTVRFGIQTIGCRGCRARSCPRPGQPCLAPFDAASVAAATIQLMGTRSEDLPGDVLPHRARSTAPPRSLMQTGVAHVG